MAPASSSNATCSTTVCSTPSSRAHTLLNRTPFTPSEPSLQTAGNLVVGRRAVMQGSPGHPQISNKSLKDQCLWVQLHDTVDELRRAVAGFVDRYNTSWLIQRHGHRTPKEAHQAAQSVSAA